MDITKNTFTFTIPPHILGVARKLQSAGFEAYLIGGCVRNNIMGRSIDDWDLTTSAAPDDIQSLFPHTVCENDYGTVGIVFDDVANEAERFVEVTPYRTESEYINRRKPKKVSFGVSLEEDLSRRDFTINALAYDPLSGEIIDLHHGISDLHLGLIRAIGNPDDRFAEDALRLIRAVRIATQLHNEIERGTLKSIQKNASLLQDIAQERIRDEFVKILMSGEPHRGILLLHQTGLLNYMVPELLEGVGVAQNQAHSYDVFTHNVFTLKHAGVKNFSLGLRLASLMHDIGKPQTREWSKERKDWTFYIHEIVGAKMAKKIMRRLCFSNDLIQEASTLIRWHMFFSDTEKITLSAVRRMVARVGEKRIWDLIDLRKCDRIGTGRPKEQPYRLRKYVSLVEEVLREPVTPGVLLVNGNDLMKDLSLQPGPHIGYILHILLSEVLDDPSKNTKDMLLSRVTELLKLPREELKSMGEEGKLRRAEEDEREVAQIRKKHYVE